MTFSGYRWFLHGLMTFVLHVVNVTVRLRLQTLYFRDKLSSGGVSATMSRNLRCTSCSMLEREDTTDALMDAALAAAFGPANNHVHYHNDVTDGDTPSLTDDEEAINTI